MTKIIWNADMNSPWRRLGNKLFMFASMYAIAKHKGYSVFLPKDGTHIREVFDLDHQCISDLPIGIYQKVIFDGDNNLSYKFNSNAIAELNSPLVEVIGYLQSWKYYRNLDGINEKNIIQAIPFKKHINQTAAAMYDYYQNIGNNDKIVSVHVRRTDFTMPKHKHFAVCDLNYYQRASELLCETDSNLTYVVFTDDVQYCREMLPKILSSNSKVLIDTQSDGFALCTMSKFKYHIISNSTFSWWGAFLSGSRNVICPSKVFTPKITDSFGKTYDDDFYLPEWKRCDD